MTGEIMILIAEDEALIVDVLCDVLEEAGFGPQTSSTGSEAIKLLDAHAEQFAALITDIRLGDGVDGWEVARHARELNPAIPVIYMSGDSAADWAVNGVPNSMMLQKPFAHAQLVTAVSTLVNEARSKLG